METPIHRFEQQLTAFEKLHANELKDFEQKLATYIRLHTDEVKLLREELAELKKAIGTPLSAPAPTHSSASAGEESNHDKPRREESST